MDEVSGSLAAAIIALHAEVRTLPKDGWNSHSDYSYAKGDTVVREARALLAKHDLVWIRTGSRLKAPTLLAGRLGKSKDYVGDVEIAGLIMHSSGACLPVAGEVPIVVMAALPHDKSWAASTTFGTGYVLLGVLNQDKADQDDISARADSERKVCSPASARANKELTEELAVIRDTTREKLWAWACDKCGIKPDESGLPLPHKLYEGESEAINDVLTGLMASSPKPCTPEQSALVRTRRIAFAALVNKLPGAIWGEVCKRIGAPEIEPERLSETHAIAAAELLSKWIEGRKKREADGEEMNRS